MEMTIPGAILPMKNAPAPNPMTASPVTRPLLSGNHRMSVAMGVTYPKPFPSPAMRPKPR
jgi:hypothetical protein